MTIREALVEDSSLALSVNCGIQALKKVDRSAVDEPLRTQFRDSLDLDTALATEYPNAPRWDYLLGHCSSGIVALEIHPATASEVGAVIAKKEAAVSQLRDHLKPGHRVDRWYWAASGRAALGPGRSRFQLAMAGIVFVGRRLLQTHL